MLPKKGNWSMQFSLIAVLLPLHYVVIRTLYGSGYLGKLLLGILISTLSFAMTYYLIPFFLQKCFARGLRGNDLNKTIQEGNFQGHPVVPEALGIVPGITFMISVILCQFLFSDDDVKLLEYNAALLSISLMTLLGFADDVLDLPWRFKLILPLFASLPLLLAYRGSTSIMVPGILKHILAGRYIIDLGFFYYFYMILLTIFCSNSINIYAGLNGLETGQSLIISFFIVIYNLIELSSLLSSPQEATLHINAGITIAQNFFSLLVSLCFIGSSLALWCYNCYPSKAFVGDTFTYSAGMYFAVVGILGHFSRTVLLFFIPQILNFMLSLPQLFLLIPCPKHRIPRLNIFTGKLEASPNLTIINAVLMIIGPTDEQLLVRLLLLFQCLCCGIGLWIRYSPIYHLFV